MADRRAGRRVSCNRDDNRTGKELIMMMMTLRVPLLIAASGLQVRDTGKDPGLHS